MRQRVSSYRAIQSGSLASIEATFVMEIFQLRKTKRITNFGGALRNSTKGERGEGDAVLAKSLSSVLVDAFSASYIVDAQEPISTIHNCKMQGCQK